MGRCIGDGEGGLLSQRLDGALALCQEVKQLEASRAGQRLAQARELGVHLVLEGSPAHPPTSHYSISCLNSSSVSGATALCQGAVKRGDIAGVPLPQYPP